MTSSKYYNEEKNKIEQGVLYVVGTPIGNMSDISERALKVLSGVNYIAAEDTRNTGKLLSMYGIDQDYISYHEHNKAECGPKIIERLKQGSSIALVTDAGMPAISDPGEDLVRLCAENSVKVTCIPGACALITALVLSGLNTRRFSFEGFLSANKGERKEQLEKVKDDDRTLIFYEAPHKLKKTLADILDILGNRNIALCRELTKLNEEINRTTVEDAIRLYNTKEPRGEYVLIIEGVKAEKREEWASLTVEEHVNFYVSNGMDKMDAIKRTAKDRGVPKGEIYKQIIK